MTLRELLPALAASTDGLHVLAYWPWHSTSECELASGGAIPDSGVRSKSLEYFLDAKTARVIFERSRGSTRDRVETVIFYAAFRTSGAWLAY